MENTQKTPAYNKKQCPIAAAFPNQDNSDCLGESCACYIKSDEAKRLLKPLHKDSRGAS